MSLLALLVSTDASASEILARVVPVYGIALERFSDLATAIDRCHQQVFDTLIVDFEEPKAAAEMLEASRRLTSGRPPVTVPLDADGASARDVLSRRPPFILSTPLFEQKTKAVFR